MQQYILATAMLRYQLPEDKTDVLAKIVGLLDSAQSQVRLFMYGFTHSDISAALDRAFTRGVDVRLVLDHTQSLGPTEQKALHSMLAAGFPEDRITITTSQDHRQIMHMKVLVVDGRYSCEGSFNYSPSGLEQENSFIVFDCPQLATDYLAEWQQLNDWARTTEAKYQHELDTPPTP